MALCGDSPAPRLPPPRARQNRLGAVLSTVACLSSGMSVRNRPKLGLWMVLPSQLIVMVGLGIAYTVTGGSSLSRIYHLYTSQVPSTPVSRTQPQLIQDFHRVLLLDHSQWSS